MLDSKAVIMFANDSINIVKYNTDSQDKPFNSFFCFQDV